MEKKKQILSGTSLKATSYPDLVTVIDHLQGAWIFFGERWQEDVGKVDEKSTDGLFGCVEKPGKHKMEHLKSVFYSV